MTSRALYVVVLLGAAALLAFVRVSGRLAIAPTPNPAVVTDAAFRDGLYQAQLDVRQKRHAHITSGRWSTTQDRVSFVAGYEQGYTQTLHAARSQQETLDAAQLAGYADGISDGVHDRKAAVRFQPGKSDRVRVTAPTFGSASDAYRQGYTNGYQQGYYSQEASFGEMIGQASQQF
jgi:hypothetical protein